MKAELIEKGERLKAIIERNREKFGCVIQPSLTEDSVYHLQLSDPKNIVSDVDPADVEGCWKAIQAELKKQNKVAAIGGYAEKRTAYRVNPELFGREAEERCVHLGVDIWMAAGTNIHAPLDAVIHSFANNNSLGNYGPTIILKHQLEAITFYSLYGHLTTDSLRELQVGQPIGKGEAFTAIGESHENGNWVPHLHYQVIADMMGESGDFIGVSTKVQADFYLSLCPEPVVL